MLDQTKTQADKECKKQSLEKSLRDFTDSELEVNPNLMTTTITPPKEGGWELQFFRKLMKTFQLVKQLVNETLELTIAVAARQMSRSEPIVNYLLQQLSLKVLKVSCICFGFTLPH